MRRIVRAVDTYSRKSFRIPRNPFLRGKSFAFSSTSIFAFFASSQAYGQASADPMSLMDQPQTVFLMVAAFAGLCMAGLSGGYNLWSRNRSHAKQRDLELQLSEARQKADHAERLLHADEQLTLTLRRGPVGTVFGAKLFGALSLGDAVMEEALATDSKKLLNFEDWLEPDAASELSEAVADLMQDGTSFSQAAHTLNGGMIEIVGRMAGNEPMLRFRTLDDQGLEMAELRARHKSMSRDTAVLRALLQAASMPVWMRDDVGRLTWVNKAYADAVDASDADIAVSQDLELLDSEARAGIIKAQQSESVTTGRMSATMAGQRRALEVVDVRADRGSAGIATDVSAVVEAENDLNSMLAFHARTLDQLATPIAVFGTDQRLQFFNSAYQKLWELEPSFLEAYPLESEILDRLRSRRLLQEQSDFGSWRKTFLEHYKSMEPVNDWWHLPDGRSLHVMTTPHPQGGITQIFENVTEELDLRSKLKRVSQVQGETLDHLSEGVAVFASDGRLQLSNPAFGMIWNLDEDATKTGKHISEIVDASFAKATDWTEDVTDDWQAIAFQITGLEDRRNASQGQIVCAANKVVDFAIVPLPDGLSMLTFVDVTDTVQVKQALIDRNQALEAADAIKSTFIKHVSYALRAPLTNIIGFAQLLAEPKIGALNEKQDDYVDHILTSSSSLMAIINDVLDLATVEAGIVELELGEVDVTKTISAVVEASQDRINETKTSLKTNIPESIGSFIGDAKRVRQVLFNVLSNAIRFSEPGTEVSLTCRREDNEVIFSIADQGPGIPEVYLDTAFQPFESTAPSDGRRNVGLGLSIVEKFMELHRGNVEIQSQEGKGTTVTCRFPVEPEPIIQAAE
ncbi:MAG: PAS-domain containing protein [Hyphomicrobiales bacterium]